MPRHTHRKSEPIRPQWAGTEEATPLTNAEMAHFRDLMGKYESGELNILDCLEEPPSVVRATIR